MVFRGLHYATSHLRLLIISRLFHSSPRIMENVYVRFPNGSSTFNVTFHYSNQILGVDRKFNLQRQSSETVAVFLQRVQQNVEKVVLTAQSKKRKKMKTNVEATLNSIGNQSLEPVHITVELLKSGNIVPSSELCSSVLKSNELLTLSFLGKKYHVIVNAPWIDSIHLPNSILSGFPVYPCKFNGDFLERGDCVFEWYRNTKENEWFHVGSGFMYTPCTEDVDHLLKVECEPRRGSLAGPIGQAISKCVVQAGPGPCPFETRHAFTTECASGKSFRVVSYNILAGLYSDTDVAKTELFSHCPPYALDIDYRKQLLLKEILGYNADIICLQEVDTCVFEEDLIPNLSLRGFEGIHHKKGNVKEGLACFVNSRKFRLANTHVSVLGAELSERPCYAQIWEKVKDNQPLLARIKDRSTSSQATVLQNVENPQEWLVVGNTHLYFHPDADHVRLLQAGQSILFFNDIIEKMKEENPGAQVSLLFCGDFNSTPECGIFQLMTTGCVSEDFIDWKSNEEEAITGLALSQPFSLGSACGIPQFTNYTMGFAACIDYIFYQLDKYKVNQVIPFYSEEELKRFQALPNVVFPSDHVALVADLERTE